MALNDRDFLKALNTMFGYRLGRFIKVGKRSCYPLHLMKSTQDVYQNVVLIGNASHTLHPVAGQGLNLGLRDIATLVDLLADNKTSLSSHISKVLQNYQAMRQPDYQTVINYTHRLVHLFSNDAFPLPQLRSTGLLAVDRIAPLRRLLAQQSMGLNFRQSRLARGLAVR
jgi:2-octaprenyl-6-methoxyphenol hydroxylase